MCVCVCSVLWVLNVSGASTLKWPKGLYSVIIWLLHCFFPTQTTCNQIMLWLPDYNLLRNQWTINRGTWSVHMYTHTHTHALSSMGPINVSPCLMLNRYLHLLALTVGHRPGSGLSLQQHRCFSFIFRLHIFTLNMMPTLTAFQAQFPTSHVQYILAQSFSAQLNHLKPPSTLSPKYWRAAVSVVCLI